MWWMNHRGHLNLYFLIGMLGLFTGCGLVRRVIAPVDTTVYFSPDGGGTEAIVHAINSAQRRIWVQAYSFTSAPIAEALVAAHNRGVEVVAILDKSNQTDKYTAATFLTNAGIKTLIDDQHAIAHNKVMVIDDRTVITGSFNFTKAAEERNAENLLILNNELSLAGTYADNIVAHAHHSQPYQFTGEVEQAPVKNEEPLKRHPRATKTKVARGSRKTAKPEDVAVAARSKRTSAPTEVHIASAQISPVTEEVRANRRSKVYRTPGCHGYDLINPDNQVRFSSEQKAIAAGYRKSEVCQ